MEHVKHVIQWKMSSHLWQYYFHFTREGYDTEEFHLVSVCEHFCMSVVGNVHTIYMWMPEVDARNNSRIVFHLIH